MTSPAITVKGNGSLGVSAALMASQGIKRLPVLDENRKLIGVLSRVDMLKQVIGEDAKKRVAKAPNGAARTLGDIMLNEIPTVHQETRLADLVGQFLEFGTRRLIVTDSEGHPLGLISDADVVTRVQPQIRHGVLQALCRKRSSPDENTTAGQLMSRKALTAPPDMLLIDAVQMMLSYKRKWITVVDDQGKAVGLVDRQVFLKAVTHPA